MPTQPKAGAVDNIEGLGAHAPWTFGSRIFFPCEKTAASAPRRTTRAVPVNHFGEMNRTRRALAHTGTLTETDVERVDFRVREWLRVVG
jgi:hypothetical protein